MSQTETTKFIYITDVHYGASPRTRKDNYNSAILKKLMFVLQVCLKNNANLLIGGDLFDKPKINFFDFNALVRLFRSFSTVDKFCVHGNDSHDGLEEESPLSFLREAGIFQATRGSFWFGSDIQLILEPANDSTGKYKVSSDAFNILMTHKTIVVEPVIFDHVLMEDFQTEAQIVTVGHYHAYQGIIKRDDGVHFLAPGALARRKNISHEIEREIKAVFFSICDKKLKTMKEIVIPSEKDVWNEKKVLDMDDEAVYTDLEAEVDTMKAILDEQIGFMTLEDHLKLFANKTKAKPETLEMALAYVKG